MNLQVNFNEKAFEDKEKGIINNTSLFTTNLNPNFNNNNVNNDANNNDNNFVQEKSESNQLNYINNTPINNTIKICNYDNSAFMVVDQIDNKDVNNKDCNLKVFLTNNSSNNINSNSNSNCFTIIPTNDGFYQIRDDYYKSYLSIGNINENEFYTVFSYNIDNSSNNDFILNTSFSIIAVVDLKNNEKSDSKVYFRILDKQYNSYLCVRDSNEKGYNFISSIRSDKLTRNPDEWQKRTLFSFVYSN